MTRRNHPITGKPREVIESPKYLSIQGEPVMPRSDGFQGGWAEMDTLQRAAWCVIIGGFIAYWFLHAFYMPWPQALIITVVFTVWVVWVICIKASTSLMSNEADACYEPQLSDRQYTQNPGGVPFGCRGCKYCRQFVPESSKHCSICDKCVVGFDHHCRWLNTCVGAKNYKPFFLFVSTTVFCLLFHVAIGAYVLSQLFSNGDFIRSRERMMYGVDCIPAHAFFVILVMLGELAVIAPLSYLFMFHTRLIIIGKTTWQLIKARRDQQAHNAAEKAAGRLVPQARDTNADMPGLCDPVPATVNRQRPYMVPTAVVGVMPQMTSTVNTARLGAASPSPMNTSRPMQHGHTHAHSHAHSHARAPMSNSPAAR